MTTMDMIMKALIAGRNDGYLKKTADYNPYRKSELYDWEFNERIDGFLYTDSYRGVNPYSGVEYLFAWNQKLPVWSCDYIGYVNRDEDISVEEVYRFLKKARRFHLLNCNGNVFAESTFQEGSLYYRTHTTNDASPLLQFEDFFFKNQLIARQIASGIFK